MDKRSIKTYSFLGFRASYGTILTKIADDFRFLLVTADSTRSSYLEDFSKRYPERLYNAGIAEQNMMTLASGMAEAEMPVLVSGYAAFVTLRCLEQIKIDVSYLKSNVKIIGLNAGLGLEQFGNSHYATTDIAALRALPNLLIASPSDGIELYKMLETALKTDQPMYIRLTGSSPLTMIHLEDYEFTFGKGDVLRSGQNIAIIANGAILGEVLKLEEKWQEEGWNPTVVNMHTVKPLDAELLDQLCQNHDYFITIEEHSKIGGLGSAVSEFLVSKGKIQLILGIQDQYLSAGDYSFVLENHRLTADCLWEDMMKFLKGKMKA